MEKPILRKQHGYTDYSYVPAVLMAPEILGFEDDETAKRLCRILSGTVLLSSLFTRAEWGLFKVVPYKTHLVLDFSVGAFSLAAPWIFSFAKNKKARNAFLAMGLFGISASLLSKPEEMPFYKR